jgi:hypothetical protein
MKTTLRMVTMSLVLAWLAGCALGPSTLKLKSSVIDNETVWSGEVTIDGVVTVKKSGRLVIEPGTRVLFVHRDRDGDGIGDSELLIEGALVARGTAESPIVFTSASARPQRADWKYLYLDFASEVDIDYIISEYAYSGLQIHFCRARVTNSIFRHNVDGLRFSTVNLLAAGNRMYDNQHGLRYEERRSKAHLHHNDIRDNDVGVFVVTRSTDKALIEQNNIADNRQYNVKLGWQQPGDVTLPRNWWGKTEPQAIKKTFLDQDIDGSLGRVSAPQPLPKPIDIHNWQKD